MAFQKKKIAESKIETQIPAKNISHRKMKSCFVKFLWCVCGSVHISRSWCLKKKKKGILTVGSDQKSFGR